MISVHLKAEVPDDRRIVVTLPSEVPPGPVELEVIVRTPTDSANGTPAEAVKKKDRFCLADWFEGQSEDWGDQIRSDDVEGFTGRRY